MDEEEYNLEATRLLMQTIKQLDESRERYFELLNFIESKELDKEFDQYNNSKDSK